MTLQSVELNVAIEEAVGSRATAAKERDSIRRRLLEQQQMLRPEERDRLEGKQQELEQQLIALDSKLKLLAQKQEDLQVVAPIDGVVTTWDLKNRLIERPVQLGQILLRIGKLDGQWEMEIHMTEDRMGDITLARKAMAQDEKQRVSYILASQPGTWPRGRSATFTRLPRCLTTRKDPSC